MSDPILSKALAFTRRGKYEKSITMLEAEIPRYQDSFQYFHILALSCLYAGDFGGAFTYFNKAKSIKFRETGPLLGLALYFLKRGDTGRAVDLYLEVQDIEPGNKTAKKALALIRKKGAAEELAAWIAGGKAARLYPPLPGGKQYWRLFVIPLALLAGIALAGGGILFLVNKEPKPKRSGMEESALSSGEKASPVETGGVYRYVLTADELAACYNEARVFFNDYRDEKAKYNLNRILESNAAPAVKNKARLLESYTAAPGFDTLKDRFTYAEVTREPVLFRNCYVLWKGMAANIVKDAGSLSFDLLVGYDTRTVMEGAVSVNVAFPADISASTPLELLGKIIINPGQDTFTLEAAGIHQLGSAGRR